LTFYRYSEKRRINESKTDRPSCLCAFVRHGVQSCFADHTGGIEFGTHLGQATEAQITVTAIQAMATETRPASTNTPEVTHLMRPSDSPPRGQLIYDVESSGTAPEKRAPYGDSHKINRFERPFLQDMTYIPDMDIVTFSISKDDDWYYISIELIGEDPNNPLGIHYGAEIDLDSDGFADYLLWGSPLYETEWTTRNVQVAAGNHDTGRSRGPVRRAFTGDGRAMIFNGGAGRGPDLAWARIDVALPHRCSSRSSARCRIRPSCWA
jgi:hypothetical protein